MLFVGKLAIQHRNFLSSKTNLRKYISSDDFKSRAFGSHTGIRLASSVPESNFEAAPPDAIFDAFQLLFSPLGLISIAAVLGALLAWDTFKAVRGQDFFGAPRESKLPSKYFIRFAIIRGGIYESPSGGAERAEPGVLYLEELDSYQTCVSFQKQLERTFGKNGVQSRIVEAPQGDVASFVTKGRPSDTPPAAGAAGSRVNDSDEPSDPVDREWRKVMRDLTLSRIPGKVGLGDVVGDVITPERACRLCNGKGFCGCSRCSTASAGMGARSGDKPRPGKAGCPVCGGSGVCSCELCGGSGLSDPNVGGGGSGGGGGGGNNGPLGSRV